MTLDYGDLVTTNTGTAFRVESRSGYTVRSERRYTDVAQAQEEADPYRMMGARTGISRTGGGVTRARELYAEALPGTALYDVRVPAWALKFLEVDDYLIRKEGAHWMCEAVWRGLAKDSGARAAFCALLSLGASLYTLGLWAQSYGRRLAGGA